MTTSRGSDDQGTPGGHGVVRTALAGGAVRRVGRWAVGLSNDAPFAVSMRCRHQLGDLTKGRVDADGCLVCPWHGAAYDVTSGRMVSGPRGFFGYHGPSRGYREVVRAYAQFLPLRRRPTTTRGERVEVD